MVTLVGGTFSRMHKGHKLLLKTAIGTGEKVIIGLTTDKYTAGNKEYKTPSFTRRMAILDAFMKKMTDNYEILPLDSRRGNADTVKEYDCIVVSKETERSAIDINTRRKRNGLLPMRIIVVPYVLADDLFPISSSRIHAGEINTGGHRISPVRISVTTENDLKADTVRDYLSSFMGKVTVRKYTEYTLPTQQPFGDDTARMATKRAIDGLYDFDYSIGIESGLLYDRINSTYIDVHMCAVVDRFSRITVGSSSGFQVPDNVVDLVKRGETESGAFSRLYVTPDIGKAGGIVGKISADRLTRKELIRESVRNAFVPRFSPDYYPELFSRL
ncbi:MAG: pantetheine-phosphate adenylyltransferase [Thermoplasmataceae archaeon]